MKLVSWNVNGLRSVMQKGFEDFFNSVDADIFCIQETKMQEGQVTLQLQGYKQYWNSAMKKGYSGTAVFVKNNIDVKNINLGMDIEKHDNEGRIINLEFEKFYLVNVYTPNSKRELERLDYRMQWEDDFRNYLQRLDKIKPVIICGDLNVAHKEIDLKNPASNTRNAGFTIEERDKMTSLLQKGFVDTYRYLYKDKKGAYTWWSYMHQARQKDIGWRIDYFIISERIKENMQNAYIYKEIYGSDHCPIGLDIDI